MTSYVIDTDRPTNGPWRETPFGNRYASVTMADGRKFHVAVEKDKKVRIPYKPRPHNYGWTYLGSVKDAHGRCLMATKVGGSIGVLGLLTLAGLLETYRVEKTYPNVPAVVVKQGLTKLQATAYINRMRRVWAGQGYDEMPLPDYTLVKEELA